LRTIIASLYERPFDKALIFEISAAACSLVDAQYHSLYLFPAKPRSTRKILSNNTSDYLEVYSSVKGEDYLLGSVLESGREYFLSRDPLRFDPGRRNFNDTVQAARPIADVAYLPLRLGLDLAGVWTFAKAGLASTVFSEDDIDVLRFVVFFLNRAFERSLLPPPLGEDLAFLDSRGNVLASGVRVEEAFRELFGGSAQEGRRGDPMALELFRRSYRRFMREPYAPGADSFTLTQGTRRFAFRLKPLQHGDLAVQSDGIAYASLQLMGAPASFSPGSGEDSTPEPSAVSSLFSLRESEVMAGIRMGKSNKQIAFDLKVEEGTVKRYTHNIYEKTGFKSRVELLLGLSAESGAGSERHKP
jgi:DNA-binding CsgD family transcriptional regulator